MKKIKFRNGNSIEFIKGINGPLKGSFKFRNGFTEIILENENEKDK